MRRKRTRRSGRPISTRSRAASGDHARLYELVYNRALASQMASARLERTTVELSDGAGQGGAARHRPGRALPRLSRALRGRPRREGDDEDGARMPALREGDAPAKTGVEAIQHFTQPPPRYSEASLVKRLEELGIGRPSTYASTLQTLKDREYVRVEKNRFIPEESGRLVTAFLERFFETLRQLRLHRRARGRAGRRLRRPARLAEAARRLLARLQAEGRRGHGAEAVGDHRRRSTSSSRPGCIRHGRRQRPARLPAVRQRPAVAARRQVRRVRRLLQLSRLQIHAEVRPGRRRGGRATARPISATASTLKTGRFGPYVERGDKRASIPRTSRSRT